MGGNLAALRWLVEAHCTPMTTRDPRARMISVQTSEGRTLLDIAMTGKSPKMDILVYLIQHGIRINDMKDPALAPKTLEVLLKGNCMVSPPPRSSGNALLASRGNPPMIEVDVVMEEEDDDEANAAAAISDRSDGMTSIASATTALVDDDDLCALCCESKMDCVLLPCGHQVCCFRCGNMLTSCPACKVSCSVLRIFRQ
jgi:Zinc finger, C3HC4 type (RING finger)